MKFRLWLKRASIILLILLATIFTLFIFSLSSSPHIQPSHQIDAQTAQENKNIVKRLLRTLKTKQEPIFLSVSQTELNGLAALAHRAIPTFNADVQLLPDIALFRLSVALPFPEWIKYLNIEFSLYPSRKNIELSTIKVGSIKVPGSWLVNFFIWASNNYVKEEFGTSMMTMINSIEISPEKLVVDVDLPDDFKNSDLSAKDALLTLRDKLAIYGDVEVISFYYNNLLYFIERAEGTPNLIHCLSYIFEIAQQRSTTNLDYSAVSENSAALTALALYFGHDKFELLVGDISNLTRAEHIKRKKLQNTITLRGRVDIQKHYIYSIALQLFSTTDASDALGEMKELLDSNRDGSGFSFADLMADRAGTRLAALATLNEEQARKVQRLLSQAEDENDFLPSLIGLPEGISKQVFEENYQNVNSPVYKVMLATIDERLAKLPLYQ